MSLHKLTCKINSIYVFKPIKKTQNVSMSILCVSFFGKISLYPTVWMQNQTAWTLQSDLDVHNLHLESFLAGNSLPQNPDF